MPARFLAVGALAITALALHAVPADARTLRSDTGVTYAVSCNANGFVLSNQRSGERIFFGRSGDVLIQGRGTGRWCVSNGGMVANFGNREIIFPRQEPYCPGQGFVDYGPLCSDE